LSRRTKKVGIVGKFGPRYGLRVRKQIAKIEIEKKRKHTCPRCRYIAIKRIHTGIWKCKHCGFVFAGGAYTPVHRKTVIGVPEEGAMEVEANV